MKKKFIVSFAILSYLLLLVFSGCTFANWSQGEFERYCKQCYISYDNANNNDFYINWFTNFISSSVYNQYKDSIPFDQYDSLLLRNGNNDTVTLMLFNSGTTLSVASDGKISPSNGTIYGWCIMFNCDRRSWSFTYNTTYSDYGWDYANNFYVYPNSSNFCLIFTISTIVNQYNKVIYGYNYTINTPVYNGSVNADIGQYYKLCSGFIGSYYYDNNNYQNLDYVILCNDSTEYVGLRNIYYTPTTNGNIVDIYVYVESSMSQKGYKVITYYDNELMYNEPGYTTFIINGGSSSGDPGGGSSVDLTETNNLITGVINTIRSGDNSIINTIRSGDSNIVNAIRSGDAYVVSSILDDSETDSLLGDLYSSGDDIYDLVNELGFQRYDNPYQNIIFGFIEDLCDSLTSSGDAYIDVNLHNGQTKRIYASQFYIADPTLRLFVSTFLVFGILFVMYNYFRKSIDSLSSGDVKKVIDNVEVDTNFIKM